VVLVLLSHVVHTNGPGFTGEQVAAARDSLESLFVYAVLSHNSQPLKGICTPVMDNLNFFPCVFGHFLCCLDFEILSGCVWSLGQPAHGSFGALYLATTRPCLDPAYTVRSQEHVQMVCTAKAAKRLDTFCRIGQRNCRHFLPELHGRGSHR